MKQRLLDFFWRVGLAFGAIATATVLTILLLRVPVVAVSHVAPFFFLAAVLACSWAGGYTAGITSVIFAITITSALTRRQDHGQIDLYRLAVLTIVSATVSWIAAHRKRVEADLRAGVEQKTAELQIAIASLEREVQERKTAEDEVRRLNHLLEIRVNERTRQLEVSNQELESFSYSVSHDLRAPLRSIDGFSRIILSSCYEKFDDEEKALFQRVLSATSRMSELIDDLLNLARVTRAPLRRGLVDLTQMAGRIAGELQKEHPATNTEYVIQPHLEAMCDSGLAEVVLRNLLENAWKFSSLSPSPVVEFGASMFKGEYVLYVKDNGAGFDPAYKSKLFVPFQRLHRNEDFPGTGVGLATVSRIVHRHGGWITAEAQTGKGATFLFTLCAAPVELAQSDLHLPEEPNPSAPRPELPSSSSAHSALT